MLPPIIVPVSSLIVSNEFSFDSSLLISLSSPNIEVHTDANPSTDFAIMFITSPVVPNPGVIKFCASIKALLNPPTISIESSAPSTLSFIASSLARISSIVPSKISGSNNIAWALIFETSNMSGDSPSRIGPFLIKSTI